MRKTLTPTRLRQELAKEARVDLRLSEADKASMVAMAKRCGLTLTEYLTALHRIAAERLGEDENSRP